MLLIFSVKSVGACRNDVSFIYSLTRLLKSQASRIVTTDQFRPCGAWQKGDHEEGRGMNVGLCRKQPAVAMASEHSRKITCSRAMSHYIHPYVPTVRSSVPGEQAPELTICRVYPHLFGRKKKKANDTFPSVFSRRLNFSFQHSVRLNSKSYFSCGLRTLFTHIVHGSTPCALWATLTSTASFT